MNVYIYLYIYIYGQYLYLLLLFCIMYTYLNTSINSNDIIDNNTIGYKHVDNFPALTKVWKCQKYWQTQLYEQYFNNTNLTMCYISLSNIEYE